MEPTVLLRTHNAVGLSIGTRTALLVICTMMTGLPVLSFFNNIMRGDRWAPSCAMAHTHTTNNFHISVIAMVFINVVKGQPPLSGNPIIC